MSRRSSRATGRGVRLSLAALMLLVVAAADASSWQIHGAASGLPHDVVNCVAIGRNRLAVGTAEGVAIYDGDHCQWQIPSLPERLAKIRVRDLDFDANGNLWMATPGGVVSVQGEKVIVLGVEDGLPTVDVERVQVLGPELFVGTFGGHVLRAHLPVAGRCTFTAVNFASALGEEHGQRMKSIGVTGLAMQNQTTGWISTKGAGMVRSQGLSQVVIDTTQGLKSDWVECFWKFAGPLQTERMVVGTQKGINFVQDLRVVGYVSIPAKSENTWVTAMVAYFNEENPDEWKGANESFDLVTFMNRRTLWVGTKDEGLFRFENGKWTNYTPDNSLLPSRCINRLYFHRGRLLVCTDAGLTVIPLGSHAYDEFKNIGKGGRIYKKMYPHLTVSPINFLAKKADFWVACDDGLARFVGTSLTNADLLESSTPMSGSVETVESTNPEFSGSRPLIKAGELTWQRFYRENHTLHSNKINGLIAGPANHAWMIFDRNLLARVRFEESPKKRPDDTDERREKMIWEYMTGANVPWADGTALTALWFSDGVLYVGTEQNGFYYLENPGMVASDVADLKFQWVHRGQREGLLRRHVTGFARQVVPGGVPRLAIMHPEAVTLYDQVDFTEVPLPEGTKMSCILGDGAGNLWIGTDGFGLYRYFADGRMTSYTKTNAGFASNRIVALARTPGDSVQVGIALWVSTDATPPDVDRIHGANSDDGDGAVHYFDGYLWDRWLLPNVRCILAEDEYVWFGTSEKLERMYIPGFLSPGRRQPIAPAEGG